MGSTSRKGQAQINPGAPEALGICDRCGRLFNLRALSYQYEWIGTQLQNTHLKVCNRCMDVPNEQLRAITLPPDPLPVSDPRIEPFAIDERNDYTISALFTGRADMTAAVEAELSPIVATFSVTASMTAGLQLELYISALISGAAGWDVAFMGQNNISAVISGTANISALLQAGLTTTAAFSTVADMAATIQRGQHVTATISSTAGVAASLQLGLVLPSTVSCTAAVAADLTVTPAAADIDARYVGSYAYDFAGTASDSVNIPGSDFTLATGNKQILVILAQETEFLINATIAGVAAPMIAADYTTMFAGTYTGPNSGTVTVSMTCEGSSTDAGFIQVYELVNSQPLYSGFFTSTATDNTALQYTPVGGVAIAGAQSFEDAVTFTWSNLTERVDIDQGTTVVSTADNLTPYVSAVRNAVTATPSTAEALVSLVSAVPTAYSGVVRGGFVGSNGNLPGSSTFTFPADGPLTDHENAGDFKLIMIISYEANPTVTSVTYDGNACTLIGSAINTAATPDLRIYAYEFDVTQAGTFNGDIDINFSASVSTFVFLSVLRLYDVGSVGTPQSATGSGTGTGVNLNVSNDALVLGVHVRGTTGQRVTWTGAQEAYDLDLPSFGFSIALQWAATGNATYNLQAASGSSGQFATLGIPFQP